MRKQLGLMALALLVNALFLSCYNPRYFYAITQLHGQVGYNLCKHHTALINPALTQYMGERVAQAGTLVDYNDIPPAIDRAIDAQPGEPFPINDTIGYGVVLALLWKLSGSFSFVAVQWLQIVLFVLLMPLVFACARMLFNERAAVWCAVAHALFPPLIAMNVQPVRDIWAYYGLILLLYGLLSVIIENRSWVILLWCVFGFCICQWVRPSVFAALVAIAAVLVIYALCNKQKRATTITAVGVTFAVTIFCFWVPFIAFNQAHYGRSFVGPVGQDLLEGLGEFENPWGYQLSDGFVSDYITAKYGTRYGTPAFDDDAKKEFLASHAQQPHLFYLNMFKRIPQLALPALPWIYYEQSPYGVGMSLQEKLQYIARSWQLLLDFLLRHVLIRVLLLVGYIGAAVALKQKRYFAVALLLCGVMVGGWGKLPSHIEYRYLVPFYWVFAWLIGFVLYELRQLFKPPISRALSK